MAVRVITLGLLIGLSLATFADTLTGKVVKITDGDTLYVLDANYQQHKIRLAGDRCAAKSISWMAGNMIWQKPCGEHLFSQVLVVGSSRFTLGQLECLQLAVSSRQRNADDLAFRRGRREKRGNTVRYFGAFALRAPMLRRRMLGEVFGALEAFAAFLTTVQVGRHVVPPL